MITKNQANIRLSNSEQQTVNALNLSPTELFGLGLKVAVAQRNPSHARRERMNTIKQEIMFLEAELTSLEEYEADMSARQISDEMNNKQVDKIFKRIVKTLKTSYERIEEDDKWRSVLETNFNILIQEGWSGTISDLEKTVTGVKSEK